MTVRRRGRAQGVPNQTKKRSCEGKTPYATQAKAQNVVRNRIEQGAHSYALNAYRCKFCPAWHVGSTPGNLGKR